VFDFDSVVNRRWREHVPMSARLHQMGHDIHRINTIQHGFAHTEVQTDGFLIADPPGPEVASSSTSRMPPPPRPQVPGPPILDTGAGRNVPAAIMIRTVTITRNPGEIHVYRSGQRYHMTPDCSRQDRGSFSYPLQPCQNCCRQTRVES
jgi:hypothetical protein